MRKIQNKIPTKVQKLFASAISRIKSQTPNLHLSTAISVFHGGDRLKSLKLCTNGHFLPRLHLRCYSHRHQESETAANFHRRSATATLDDIDRYLLENFGSLYGDNENADREAEEEMPELDGALSLLDFPVPRLIDLLGSDRFFVTPASSGSLIEESGCKSFNNSDLKLNFSANLVDNQSGETPDPALIDLRFFNTPVSSRSLIEEVVTESDPRCKSFNESELKIKLRSRTLHDCVALVTASASPYEDFLQSMVDVTEARAKQWRIDWEFLEGLLFAYLRMNEKEHYRFV